MKPNSCDLAHPIIMRNRSISVNRRQQTALMSRHLVLSGEVAGIGLAVMTNLTGYKKKWF